MTFISLRPALPVLAGPALSPPREDTLNRVLHPADDPEWPRIIEATGLDRTECWGRKIPQATFQYAHLMKCVMLHFPGGVKGKRVLLPGGYEDPLYDALRAMGASAHRIDPVVDGLDLRSYVGAWLNNSDEHDLVLCASVLEHVEDDEQFLADVVECLRPGGYAFLTCDYKAGWKPGDPLAPTEERLYTAESLLALTDTLGDSVEWCGERDWQPRGDYFHYGGIVYSFASLAFRKRGGQ